MACTRLVAAFFLIGLSDACGLGQTKANGGRDVGADDDFETDDSGAPGDDDGHNDGDDDGDDNGPNGSDDDHHGGDGSGPSGPDCSEGPINPFNLEVGVWTDITPPDPNIAGQDGPPWVGDVQFDPSDPRIVYVCGEGLQRSSNGGATWEVVSSFAEPARVRIDPNDPNHLLSMQGVNASGFFASTDGGETWFTPPGFLEILPEIGNDTDMYGIDVDPTDFGHFLLTFHWYWDGCQDGCKSGIVECFDGGETCVAHDPIPGVAANGGHNAFFLYNPELGIGDDKTWIFMTQEGGSGAGWWRTTNAGESWERVNTKPMIHGGSQLYYTGDGTLYAAAFSTLEKSTDNGVTWTSVWTQGLYAIHGDGTNLYAISQNGGTFHTLPESGVGTWTSMGGHSFARSANALTYDPCSKVLYAAMREDGAWALKLE